MNSSKNIGRLVLLKHYLLIVGLALAIPVFIELLGSGQLNASRAISGFYKLASFDAKDTIFLLIQLLLILIGIWFFGGRAGRLIANNGKIKLRIGFMAMFKLWGIFIITSIIYEGIPTFGWTQLGILMFVLLGAIHSLIVGYSMTKRIKTNANAN